MYDLYILGTIYVCRVRNVFVERVNIYHTESLNTSLHQKRSKKKQLKIRNPQQLTPAAEGGAPARCSRCEGRGIVENGSGRLQIPFQMNYLSHDI